MSAADNSEGKLTTAFSKCYYLVLLVSSGYHLFIAHSSTLYNTPADSTNIRGRRGGISSNNNAMYGDATKSNGEFVNSIFYYYLIIDVSNYLSTHINTLCHIIQTANSHVIRRPPGTLVPKGIMGDLLT